MADNLIFPIKFDLEKAVTDAQADWGNVQRKMETMINSRPLKIPIKIDQSSALFNKDGIMTAAEGSIKSMRAEMSKLIDQWNSLSQTERTMVDSNGNLIGTAAQIVSRFAELTTASRTYAQSLTELQSAADRAVKAQEKDLLKQQADQDKAYQKWLESKNKEAVAAEKAEAKKRAAYNKTLSEMRQAAAQQAAEAYRTAKALKAQETSLDAINAKLRIYNQMIQGQKIGSVEWEKSALEIRRLTDELTKATTRLKDFQQASFKGLADNFASYKVEELTRLRNQLDELDKRFNQSYQLGAAYDANGALTSNANNILIQRQQIVKQINEMLYTAADAQAKREKEINAIIEQRKAKADAIAAKKKAEVQATQANIAKLKEERRILNQQESSIANITAKLEIQRRKLNSADMGGKEFEKIAKEVERLTLKLEKANAKVRELTGQTQTGANKQAAAQRNVNMEYQKQTTYVERLIQRLMVYASLSYAKQFLENIKNVTAEFELQRISLGAIIQDQNKANQLFGQIKNFALKSPVKILDLTKYTKQLAAYKVGWNGVKTDTDELFDTMKRLTDISVGLGVSMDRIVLLFGQVRATGYLRASEVRQATEAGIPLVEELARKLTEARGELVSSADVLEMISKRAISFDMVKEVFDDMTSAGGIFYNMQEKQGNTLYGMWAKLGDAASLMYEQMGNTNLIGGAMKKMISWLTSLMKNWSSVGNQLLIVAATMLLVRARTNLVTVSSVKQSIAARDLARAHMQLAAAQKSGSAWTLKAAEAARRQALYNAMAARTTSMLRAGALKLAAAFQGIKSFFMSNWITLAIAAVASLITFIADSVSKANKLKNELKDIRGELSMEQARSRNNFISLANKAVNSADGTKQQKDALDELKRTYGDIIPVQELEIDKLRELKGHYEALTLAIDEKIRKEQEEKGLTAIQEEYGNKLVEQERKVKKALQERFKMTEEAANRVIENYKRLLLEGKSSNDAMFGAFRLEGFYYTVEDFNSLGRILSDMAVYGLTVQKMKQATEDWTNSMKPAYAELGKLADLITKADADVEKFAPSSDLSPIEQDQAKIQYSAQQYLDALKQAIQTCGINLKMSDFVTLDSNGMIDYVDFSGIEEIVMKSNSILKEPLLKMIELIKGKYNDLIPSDPVVRDIRSKFYKMAEGLHEGQKKMQQYLWDGKTDLNDHISFLEDSLKRIRADIYKWSQYLKIAGAFGKILLKSLGIDVDELTKQADMLEKLIAYEKYYVPGGGDNKPSGGGKTKTDDRIQKLQQIESSLAKINKKYGELVQRLGKTSAIEETTKMFEGLLKSINKIGKPFGLDFDMPLDDEILKKYREQIRDAMKKIPKSEKSVLDLQETIDTADVDAIIKRFDEILKEVADKVAKSKSAKEFYDKILAQTGDVEMSARVTMSLYGENGEDLYENTKEQIKALFSANDDSIDLSISADLSIAFDDTNEIIDYGALEELYNKYSDSIIEKQRDTLKKIIENGRKESQTQLLNLEKELAKFKDYDDRRTDIIKKGTAEREEIIKNTEYSPEEKKSRIQASWTKQNEDIAKIDVEEFTKSDYYIKAFENLDNVATPSLKRLRDELKKLIDTNKDLSPENMKTLVKAYESINENLIGRGIGKGMVSSAKSYLKTLKDLKKAKTELKVAEEEYNANEASYDAEIQAALDEEALALEKVNQLKAQGVTSGKEMTKAELDLNKATERVVKAENKKKSAYKKVVKSQEKVNNLQDDQRENQEKFMDDLQNTAQFANNLASVLSDVKDMLGLAEDSTAGLTFDAAIQGLQTLSKAIGVVTMAQQLFNIATESNPWIAIAAAVLAVASALSFGLTQAKVNKANKEIERLQDSIDAMEYSLSKLEDMQDRVFGSDLIKNNISQMNLLRAQYTAYQKQADAERSKGKKEDEEKTKEYLENARDAMDEIREMQRVLIESFTGTSLADFARDLANSWVDARLSMSNTFDAIKGDYKDMLKEMVVSGMMTKIVENAMKGLWEKVNYLFNANDVEGAIDAMVNGMDSAMQAANSGMELMWQALEQKGYDLKSLLSESDGYSGIAKNVSTATSEEINANTAALNTQNYYMATINDNVANIVAMMRSGGATSGIDGGTNSASWSDWQRQAMDNYLAIQRNTAETVIECRRAADACERIGRVVKVKGTESGLNVFIK